MGLNPGDIAPDFRLPDADGNNRSSMDWRGQKLLVYFYPAAMTPGCTTQACDFQDNLKLLENSGIAVVGISPDPPEKLAKFRDKYNLSFPLLSDEQHSVLAGYGAWGEKKLYGKTTVGVIRSTVVIDEHGRVEHAFHNVKATGHVAKLIRDLKLGTAA